MKKSTISLIIIVCVVIIGAIIFWWVYSNSIPNDTVQTTTNSTNNQNDTTNSSNTKIYSRSNEFSLSYPMGWLQNSIDNQLSALPNAGLMNGVELLPAEPVGATTTSFQAYQYLYNQTESLINIAGLLPDITTADIPHTIDNTVIQQVPAFHVVVDGQNAYESFYRSEYYLLRTNSDTVLQLSMHYPTISDYNSYHTQIDTIVDSLRLL